MRKHARILHTLLWLMHQLSQSRKRCCISTFFYHDFNQDYYNESPISSIHHYSTVQWVILTCLSCSNRKLLKCLAVQSRKVQVVLGSYQMAAQRDGYIIYRLEFFGQVFFLIIRQLGFLRSVHIIFFYLSIHIKANYFE
jgi:hypothetical protein